ncbi:MAG: tRNA (adenosine(37)-N6)-threonylcarbamoyltransferase complex ATPase subunit type 1 TsaE [Acidimicrobiales bacterium]
MIRVETASAAETQHAAAAIARLVQADDLLLLVGDLGAGKTAFTQGFGRALGVSVPITSPTFTLAQQYQGSALRLHHLDVYRLEQTNEVADLGLEDLFDDNAVVVIEWGDTITASLPSEYLEVRITFGSGDDDRVIECNLVGEGWTSRSKRLGAALGSSISC